MAGAYAGGAGLPLETAAPGLPWEGMGTYGHLLAATDLSEAANRDVLRAARMAREFGARLTVVHVVESLPRRGLLVGHSAEAQRAQQQQDESQALERICEEAHAVLGPKASRPRAVLALGHPVDRIVETARELGADLVVLSATGEAGADKFSYGDVAQRVARSSEASVIILR